MGFIGAPGYSSVLCAQVWTANSIQGSCCRHLPVCKQFTQIDLSPIGTVEGTNPQSEFLRNSNDLEHRTPVRGAAVSHLNIHESLHALNIKLATEPVGVGKLDEIAVARIDLSRERIGDQTCPPFRVWWDETVVRS